MPAENIIDITQDGDFLMAISHLDLGHVITFKSTKLLSIDDPKKRLPWRVINKKRFEAYMGFESLQQMRMWAFLVGQDYVGSGLRMIGPALLQAKPEIAKVCLTYESASKG